MSEITKARVLRRAGTPAPAPAPTPVGNTDIFGSVSEPGTIQFLKGVLFGPPKTGKTVTSLRGWPDQRKLLVLTEPEGDLSVAGRKDVDVLRPSNYRELAAIIEGLHTRHEGRWPTVVFDSVTFMIEMIGGKDINDTYLQNRDVRRAYGKVGAAVNQLVHDAVALRMNVIFTAQLVAESPSEDETTPISPEEGKYPLTLAVTPMVYKVLVPAVSFIGRTYKTVGYEKEGNKPARKGVEYWTSFEDFGKSPAGTRLPIPPQVRDLNLQDMLASLTKEA